MVLRGKKKQVPFTVHVGIGKLYPFRRVVIFSFANDV